MEIQNRAGESRILLVEDDKEIREGIEIFLRGQGYRVFQAADGVEGLEILEREEIHLAIVDIMMPRMDGVTMVIRLREHYDFPVIFLSAKSEEVDKIMGLNMGADDYLVKPFFRDELLARVHSLLRRYLSLGSASDNSGNLLQYYELTLNTELKKLYVRGDEIRLTATEYKIMSLLLSRPGRIFPAEEIYERVWEQDSYSVENTVMIHINRLRKKIELNPKKPEYLKVVWGIGYKIEK